MQRKGIVLFSGGIDSTTAMWNVKDDYAGLYALTFTYGAKDEEAMIEVTKRLSGLAGAEHRIIPLPWLEDFSKNSGSTLISTDEGVPRPGEDDLDDPDEAQKTAASVWVPARNLVFLSIAASFADSIGGNADIITGFDREEALTFPDNSEEFIDTINNALQYGVLNKEIRVVAPLMEMDKNEIAKLALKIGVPVELSLSCYEPVGFDERGRPVHCGRCESCMRRRRGFTSAGLDKTVYVPQH